MKRSTILAVMAIALGTTTLAAQNAPPPPPGAPADAPRAPGPPPPPPPPMGPPPAGADFLLGHTGELKLTDPQVVRLAAIARRAADRREANRPPQPPAPGQRPSDAEMARMRQQHEQLRDQSRADLRDALAVLTPDQQARAWEMMSHGPHGPGGPGAPGDRGRMRPPRQP